MGRSLAMLYLVALAVAILLSVFPVGGMPDVAVLASRSCDRLVALAGASASLEHEHVLRTLVRGALGAGLLVTTAIAAVVSLNAA